MATLLARVSSRQLHQRLLGPTFSESANAAKQISPLAPARWLTMRSAPCRLAVSSWSEHTPPEGSVGTPASLIPALCRATFPR